jgi:hypothetical protein
VTLGISSCRKSVDGEMSTKKEEEKKKTARINGAQLHRFQELRQLSK